MLHPIIPLVASLLFWSQNPPKPPAEQVEKNVEEAHRGLFEARPKTGEDASRLTTKVAPALPANAGGDAKVVRKNLIDEHIFGRMERDHVPHARLSADEEFVRRAYMDAIGQLPSIENVRQFLSSTDPKKRDKLIDSLVGTQEFAEQWAWFWGDLFRVMGRTGDGVNSFHFWIKEWLRIDRPYSDVVYDLLTASGKSHGLIPALGLIGRNTYDTNLLPASPDDYRVTNRLDAIDEFSIDTARLFLGVNTTCISCHDGAGHLEPINTYLAGKTRRDFFRQSAFMGGTRLLTSWDDRGKNTTNRDQVIDDLGTGYHTGNDAPYMTESMNRMPRDGKAYEPSFLLTGEKPRPGENSRAALARMLTQHIQFSRATVNLLWGRLMTVGFVEPYDGFDLARLDSQPTNPQLLEALAAEFSSHRCSVQHLIRTIMKSSAYQLSSRFDGEWKDQYTPYYARKYIRMLTGPEVVDAIAKATNRPGNYEISGLPVTRIKQLVQPNDLSIRKAGDVGENAEIGSIMQSFFQGTRETQVPDGNQPTTLQALLMTSTKAVNNRVLAEKGSRVEQLVKSGKSNQDVIEELFLASLARRPTPAEMEVALQAFERDRKEGAEDVQWALLNGIEFVLNH
jgi:hypothetical protein